MKRPDLSYLKNLILAVFGIPCGVLTGVTGLSPAPILQPTIQWLLGIKGTQLSGVVLVVVSFSAWSGMLAYAQAGHIQWLSGIIVTIGTFAGASLASNAVKRAPLFFVKARPLWTSIPLLLALTMIGQATGHLNPAMFARPLVPVDNPILPLFWSLIIGFATGFVGFAGEIGSMLTVPLLLYVLGRSIYEAEGTALFVLVLASLPTALIRGLSGTLNTKVAFALSIGGILGALYGSHVASKLINPMSPDLLILICGVALALLALISLFRQPGSDVQAPPNGTTRNS